VADQHGSPARVLRDDPLDRVDDARAERDRVDVVAVEVAVHQRRPPGVARRLELLHRHVRAVRAVELGQALVGLGRHPECLLERRGGLAGAPRRRGVQRCHLVTGQRPHEAPGLLVAPLGELGVRRAAVGRRVHPHGQRVTDEHDLHGRGR